MSTHIRAGCTDAPALAMILSFDVNHSNIQFVLEISTLGLLRHPSSRTSKNSAALIMKKGFRIMKTLVEICEECGAIFQEEKKYAANVNDHRLILKVEGAFPKVKDESCKFVNGGWNVQRSKNWLDSYKQQIAHIINIKEPPPYSYGWYRTLDDSGSKFYGLALRVMNICPECFREWGQPFYANNCDHKDKRKGKL